MPVMRPGEVGGRQNSHSAHAVTDPHEATPGVPLRQNGMIRVVVQGKSQFPRNGGAGTVGLVHPNGNMSRFAKMHEGSFNWGHWL